MNNNQIQFLVYTRNNGDPRISPYAPNLNTAEWHNLIGQGYLRFLPLTNGKPWDGYWIITNKAEEFIACLSNDWPGDIDNTPS